MAFPLLRSHFSLSYSSSKSPGRSLHTAAAAGSPLLLRRRGSLVGALWVLSFGAIAAVSCRATFYSHALLPILRSRSIHNSQKAVQATKMEASATTVPSIVVYVTVPNREAGKKLAGSIIGERLAACVNIVPGVESVYLWDGKVESDPEELLIIKTRESLLPALTEHVKANHEYDVPEVISLPITGGNDKYLEWLKNSTADK